jgi:tRNA (adenine22-N1)-methyltransferase
LNEHTLSLRLEHVATQVPRGACLADIGSDHAYLPVVLMRRGLIARAIAGEVALTPLRAAERTVRENGLEGRIQVRLANGLAAISPEDGVTAITLCGMGGETIRDILDSGRACLNGTERLILQPNGGERPLRQWLMDNGYRILAEHVLRENRFDYEIITADPAGPVVYTEQQLFFGPLQMQARTPEFLAKWRRLLHLRQRTLAQLDRAQQGAPAEKLSETRRQVDWITQLLS